MKKFIIVLSMLIAGGIFGVATLAENSKPTYTDDFINAMQNCRPYTYSIGPFEMFGMQVTDRKFILGKKNGLCSYLEIVGPPTKESFIRCNFTKEQVNKLVFTMKNDNSGAWQEYFNNRNVCIIK